MACCRVVQHTCIVLLECRRAEEGGGGGREACQAAEHC